MERVRSPSPEFKDCYLKKNFPNLLSNTFSDFIPDMVVTDHRYYDRSYRKKIREPSSTGMLFKKIDPFAS